VLLAHPDDNKKGPKLLGLVLGITACTPSIARAAGFGLWHEGIAITPPECLCVPIVAIDGLSGEPAVEQIPVTDEKCRVTEVRLKPPVFVLRCVVPWPVVSMVKKPVPCKPISDRDS
jgi:hypothetical protein